MLTLILSSAAWLSPSLSGQTTFVYERGKMFNDVDAFRMEQAIDLKKQQTPVYYEKNIPGEQQTVSHEKKTHLLVKRIYPPINKAYSLVATPAPAIISGPIIPTGY